MKIYLIGMPGAGKSTIGREIALRKKFPFFDLDKEIEKEEGKSVSEIFSQSGESYFREIESRTLVKISNTAESFVMATGGGAPCFHGNMNLMLQNGFTVFLDPPLDLIERRLSESRTRPLINAQSEVPLLKRLEDLLNKRTPFYKQAKLRIADNINVTDRIIQLLPNNFPD